MTRSRQHALTTAAISLAFAVMFVILLPGRISSSTLASAGPEGRTSRGNLSFLSNQLPGPTGTLTSTFLYMPFTSYVPPPAIELLDVWIDDSEGVRQQGFLPGDALVYNSFGLVNRNYPLTATVTLTAQGPCEAGLIYSNTLNLPSGGWIFPVPSQAQKCTGLFTTTTTIRHGELSPALSTQHVVNPPSQVVVSQAAGFDKCAVPSVEKMQTWWDESPYSVANIYLGGALFACPSQALDAVWVYQVARQGWTFIPTWVGPQPPCTGYAHTMSWDPQDAYLEGRVEAAAAAVAARHQGLFGEQVIYYDIESYFNVASDACRDAVDAFMTGWAEQLHDFGLKAGGYGQPCSSFVYDWVDNSPPPDDVWLAYWVTSSYSPTVTVWGSTCVPDGYWANHQRIRQYTGGHSETWGGVSINIDSNVLDGEVTGLPVAPANPQGALQPVRLIRQGLLVRSMGLLGPERGWALADDRILLTEDGGESWRDITPGPYPVLGAESGDPGIIWLALAGSPQDGIRMAGSTDGGAHWDLYPLPLASREEVDSLETADLDVTDDGVIWVMLHQKSSASFSRGILFLSEDGGRSWQRRSAPIGDSVKFLDARRGWIAGGPAGDLLYSTVDGALTWSRQDLPLPDDGHALVGLPHFESAQKGWLPVALNDISGGRLLMFETGDGGHSWTLVGTSTPAISPRDPSFLLRSDNNPWNPLLSRLPEAAVSADVIDELHAWVVVQEGSCRGEKRMPEERTGLQAEPFECTQRWSLLETGDGGESWQELLLPGQ
jgi:photosystem II stability/assembly factor-like uncharacterized protein